MIKYKLLEGETQELLGVAECYCGVCNAEAISELEYNLIVISLVARTNNESAVLNLMEGLL